MSRFQNLSVALERFVHMYPRDINVYVGLHKGNCLFPDDSIYYRFLFSNEGEVRDSVLLKKDFRSTSDLYQSIQEEFLRDKKLISLGYHDTRLKGNYTGIKLQNSREERLNIYFSDDVLPQYDETVSFFQERRPKDFLEYASRPIEKRMVEKMSLRPAVDDRSGVVYILDNQEYTSSLLKQKQLGYYYNKKDGIIDQDDLKIVLDLIRLFINSNLDKNPCYGYRLDSRKQTMALVIKCDSGEMIEMTDVDLIDKVEKLGIIDDLWKVMYHKIDKMPKQIKF